MLTAPSTGAYTDLTSPAFVADVIGVDTEGTRDRPWCLSYSNDPGSGYIIRRDDNAALLDWFAERVADPQTLTVLHNALHDLPVLHALGVTPTRYTDTMIMAFLLGYEFIGLKKLAGVILGKDRESYRDVMEDANERVGRAWLESVVADFPRWPGAKPPELEKKLRLIDRMLAKGADSKPEDFGTIKEVKPLRDRWRDCTARDFFEHELQVIGPMPEATMDDLPRADAIEYAAEDADDTRAIFPVLDARIDQMGLRDVLNVDLGMIPIIGRMQEVGIKADPQHFRDLSELFAIELDNLRDEIVAMGGPDNPGSHPEIAAWLFDGLRLPSRKRTKGGERSTDKKVLEALQKNPRVQGRARQGLELLLEWRQIDKLKGTYADPMPQYIREDGRLHPQLSLTTAATGRLAAKEPNILAFPKHSERGKLIRQGFIAEDGCLLGEWDLSQVELRVLAIDSGDERMLAQFASGYDFHLQGAAQRYGKRPEDVTKHERFTQKAINFGIVMGITEYGLLDQLLKNGSVKGVERVWNKITEDWEERPIPFTIADCAQMLKDWRRDYPQAAAYLTNKHAEARRHGYVRDMWGRIRVIEDIHAELEYFRAEAERQAQATPIQSGAQGIAKRWGIEIYKRLPRLHAQGIRCEMLLQVHDAYMFEFSAGAYDAVDAVVQEALAQLQMFPIPVPCEGAQGRRWSDL